MSSYLMTFLLLVNWGRDNLLISREAEVGYVDNDDDSNSSPLLRA